MGILQRYIWTVEVKLDCPENLDIRFIWMTPILRNRAVQADGFGHHGYWVVDFTEIDPHFGNNDDLKSLMDAAHKRDIKVFFDVINHTADVISARRMPRQNRRIFRSRTKKLCLYKCRRTCL